MAENSSGQTPVYASQEVLYEKATQKMNADKLIVQYEYKIENYNKAAELFEEVGDYEDAPALAARCRQLSKETENERFYSRYQKASDTLKNAKSKKDYEIARRIFSEIEDYRDSKHKIEECNQAVLNISHKGRNKKRMKLLLLIAFLVVLAGIYFSGVYHYAEGRIYSKIGEYELAAQAFDTMGEFLNSDHWAKACRKKVEKQVAKEESIQIKEAQPGDIVSFGQFTWTVLEKENNTTLLMVAEEKGDIQLSLIPYNDENVAVTWEKCSLRKWLNGEFFNNGFSEEERSRMVEMEIAAADNTDYHTDGGNDTNDHVTIFSAEEIGKYAEIVKSIRLDYWLRNPGKEENTAVFMSGAHHVMMYGYPVNTTMFRVRPVILIKDGE